MDTFNIIVGIFGIASFVVMVIQWLYYHKVKFYMVVRKFFRRSQDVNFEVSFTYRINKEQNDIFKTIESSICQIEEVDTIRKVMNMPKHKMYSLEDFFFDVQLDGEINVDEESKELFISFPKIRTTVKNAEDILERIDSISQVLRTKLNVNSENYSMDIGYRNGNNPFFGTSIQRFGKEAVKSYKCQIDCKAIGKDQMNGKYANIYKEYVNITDESFSVIRRIGLYLLLIR